MLKILNKGILAYCLDNLDKYIFIIIKSIKNNIIIWIK